MKRIILLIWLLAACSPEPEPEPVRVSCVSAGGALELEFDRVDKTDEGLRAWKFGYASILQAECVILP